MNESQLERWLKSAPAPERDADYFEAFPRRVLAQLRQSRTAPERPGGRPEPISRLKALWPCKPAAARWALALAAACLALGFVFGFWQGRSHGLPANQVAQLQRYLEEMQALFPNQVRAIIFGAEGPRLVLSEQPNVPPVLPVCVKLCKDRQACTTILTFSGQTIQLNGETCEVLLNARGDVFLVGKHSLWSSAEAKTSAHYRIQAQPLTRL